tara:strand:- start:526 stop:1374 length:849 start_codon:yes stop_codon:yes gene_type:complete
MNNFAVFIMVHGRPNKVLTYETLRKQGYTGKIYLVGDDLDVTINDYKKIYKDKLIIFNKRKAFHKYDTGDNTGDLRSTLFSANEIFDIAKQKNIKWFFIMCDDYRMFEYRYDGNLQYGGWRVLNLDKIFMYLLNYYKKTNIKTIAFAQSGDFMGGENNILAKGCTIKRKAMNTFLCSTSRPFNFMGRMNEDVTTYVNLGSKGDLFFTISNISIYQQQTQKKSGGLTDLYLKYGTYVKSFFSLMYNPSSVKISEIGYKNKRLHHIVKWKNAVPKILDDKYKKY